MRLPQIALLLLVAAGVAACGDLDEAAMVGPAAPPVHADVGELRVLRHRDDPTAGDRWTDVLEAHPSVFERTGSFREDGSRTAEAHEPADVRVLYEAVAPGRTLVVRVDCRGCGPDGVPSTRREDTELLVWELVAGGGGRLRLGPSALEPGGVADVEVGDHVVVVRDGVAAPQHVDELLRLVASRGPGPAIGRRVDVFAAVAPGRATVTYGTGDGEVRYRVRARAP